METFLIVDLLVFAIGVGIVVSWWLTRYSDAELKALANEMPVYAGCLTILIAGLAFII